MRVILVEDDAAFAAILAGELHAFGHVVDIADDGRAALMAVDREHYDVMVLDWMLPKLDGLSVLRTLRQQNVTLPVVMLSALGRSVDKVEGLETGADDYVVKPVASEELNARLHALVRGRSWTGESSGDTIRVGDIVVSSAAFRAWRADIALDLSMIEMNLLAEFARHPGTVLTRAMLLERVWKYDFEPTTNIVDAHICRLRARLTAHGGSNPIITVRGVGYMLRV